MKIIAFGASLSKHSINKKLATYAASQFASHDHEVLDLNDYPLPVFSVDAEKEIGYPQAAHDFIAKIKSADFLIISMTEHNGSYSAGFKNLFDWTSRVEPKLFDGKKMWLLATSPGARGGQGSLQAAADRFPRHGATVVATFSLPNFDTNFDATKGITDEGLRKTFFDIVEKLK